MWRSTLWINLIDDESSTIYKLKKRRKEKRKRMRNVKKYLSLRMQKARSVLNVLHEMLCSSQSKQSSFRSFFIISRKSHHFSMRREASMARALDGASFRAASPPDLGTNGIFVTELSFNETISFDTETSLWKDWIKFLFTNCLMNENCLIWSQKL